MEIVLKKKNASIWIIQVDHVSGECLGAAFEKIMDLGAQNVQIIPSVTKKGRPGHLMFIDIPDSAAGARVERYITQELHISGYHRLATEHFYTSTTFVEGDVIIEGNGRTIVCKARLKAIGIPEDKGFPRIEQDSALSIQREIEKEFGKVLSLRHITATVESAVHQGLEKMIIRI